MQIIDISWPLSPQTTTYKNKLPLEYTLTHTYENNGMQESRFSIGSHTGTHVDAPLHFLHNGNTINTVNLSQLITPCQVIDLTNVQEKITAQDLKALAIQSGHAILFKTRNSALTATGPFDPNFVYLDASGAEYLAAKNIPAVGIDYLGIERNDPEHTTHKTLFNANIIVIEGLRLAHVNADIYTLICLPLFIQDSEAAPARAVLIDQAFNTIKQ